MIRSERCVYLAAHVTPKVMAALRKEAVKRGLSLSKLVYSILSKWLSRQGHEV